MDFQMEQGNAKQDFCVEVVGSFGEKERVDLCASEKRTVDELKKKILHLLPSRSCGAVCLRGPLGYIDLDRNVQYKDLKDWPEDIELLFENRKLVDSTLLHENRIRHKSIIYMALVYGQKKSVMKNDDEESKAGTSADEEERCKQEEMETIQVLVCFSDQKKVMAVFCVTKEEMQKMTVEQLKGKIEMNVMIGECCVTVDEVYFNGKQLKETSLLSDRGVKHMFTVEAKVRPFRFHLNLQMCLGVRETDKRYTSKEKLADFDQPCDPVMD